MTDKKADKTLWLSPLILDQGFGVQFRDDHVRVELSKDFKVNPEMQEAFWNLVRSACEKHNSRRVLVEGFVPEGDRQTTEVIDAGMRTAVIPRLWLAFCLADFQPNEQSELYEVIAASKGVRVKFFSSPERALLWLRRNSPS